MSVIDWLNQNSEAVVAVATGAGVLITGVYAFFTVLLWRATRAQAEITRSMFEASHRPYVVVEAQEPNDTGSHGRLSFNLVFRNDGSVPAEITAFEIRGTMLNLDEEEVPVDRVEPIGSPVGRSLSPHESAMIPANFVATDLPNPVLPFRLRGHVEYRGVVRSTYRTDFDAERAGDSWKSQGRFMR